MNWQYNRKYVWYGIIFGFGLLGFLAGFIIGVNASDGNLTLYLAGYTAIGAGIGFIISKLLGNAEPLYRSADLDNFQDRYTDNTKDDYLLELLPNLNDSELITAFAHQYYDLLSDSRSKFKSEIDKRQISRVLIRDMYERNVLDFHITSGDCPRCGSLRYSHEINPAEPNCLICGYNIVRDNPDTFPNKLKKMFGMYNDRRLSWIELEEHLEV